MSIYTVKNKQTGQTLKIRGNRPPTPEYLSSLGQQTKPKQSFGQKALAFGKGVVDQATGLPRMINEIGRGARNAPVLNIQEKQLSQLRQQPLTQERVAKEEEIADRMKYITKDTPFGLSAEDKQRAGQGVGESIELGIQRSAGTGAFFVPGGAGAKLGTKALYGAASGALTGASMGEDIDPIQTGVGAAFGAAVPVAMHGAGKGINFLKKGARNLSEKLTTQGLGSPASLKKASGLNPNDSLFDLFQKYDLWDRMPQSAKTAVGQADDAYQAAIVGADDTIPLGEVVRKFDDAIEELGGLADESGAVQKQIKELMKRRDGLIGKMGSFDVGAEAIYGSKKAASKDLLNTAFSQTSTQKGTGLGTKNAYNIFKGSLDDVAPGSAFIGREEAALMELAKVFEKHQGRGMGREMLNFTRLGTMGVGSLIGGLPGAIGGFVLESAVRSPSGTMILAKTFNQLSKAEIQWLTQMLTQVGSKSIIPAVRGLGNPFNEQDMLGEKPQGSNVNMKKNPYKSNKVNVEYKF